MYIFINNKGQEYVAYGRFPRLIFLLPFRKRYKNQIIVTNAMAVMFALIANFFVYASHQITAMLITLAGLVQMFNFIYVININARTHNSKITDLQPAIWQAHAHTALTIAYVFFMSNMIVNLFLAL